VYAWSAASDAWQWCHPAGSRARRHRCPRPWGRRQHMRQRGGRKRDGRPNAGCTSARRVGRRPSAARSSQVPTRGGQSAQCRRYDALQSDHLPSRNGDPSGGLWHSVHDTVTATWRRRSGVRNKGGSTRQRWSSCQSWWLDQKCCPNERVAPDCSRTRGECVTVGHSMDIISLWSISANTRVANDALQPDIRHRKAWCLRRDCSCGHILA